MIARQEAWLEYFQHPFGQKIVMNYIRPSHD